MYVSLIYYEKRIKSVFESEAKTKNEIQIRF